MALSVITGRSITITINSVAYSAQVKSCTLIPSQTVDQFISLTDTAAKAQPVTWALNIKGLLRRPVRHGRHDLSGVGSHEGSRAGRHPVRRLGPLPHRHRVRLRRDGPYTRGTLGRLTAEVAVTTGIAPSELLKDPHMFATIVEVLAERNRS